MTSYRPKKLSLLKLYIEIKKKIQIFGMNMPFISSREAIKVYFIHGSPFMKYAFFASLDDMNGIFILKISVTSLGSYYLIFVGGFLKKIVRTGLCNKIIPGLITRRKKGQDQAC